MKTIYKVGNWIFKELVKWTTFTVALFALALIAILVPFVAFKDILIRYACEPALDWLKTALQTMLRRVTRSLKPYER